MPPLPVPSSHEVEKHLVEAVVEEVTRVFNQTIQQLKVDIQDIVQKEVGKYLKEAQASAAQNTAEEVEKWVGIVSNIVDSVCKILAVGIAAGVLFVVWVRVGKASKQNPAELPEDKRKALIDSVEGAYKDDKTALVPDISEKFQEKMHHNERAANYKEIKFEAKHGKPSKEGEERAKKSKSSTPEAEGHATSSGIHNLGDKMGLHKRNKDKSSEEADDERESMKDRIEEAIIPGMKKHKKEKKEKKEKKAKGQTPDP